MIFTTRIYGAVAKKLILTVALFLNSTYGNNVYAAELRIAVASNFASCFDQIVALYHTTSHDRINVITGSTGKLYAQIQNAAPYDAFFAADAHRPKTLERQKIGFNRFTYAYGRLVLWSLKSDLIDTDATILRQSGFRFLAIANPKLAPYGRAAQQTLNHLSVFSALKNKLVQGENIAQTYQFIYSGNADLGFIALAQLKYSAAAGSYWIVPDSFHEPIDQQAIQLNNAPGVHAFMTFVRTTATAQIIQSCGYDIPT